MTTETATLVAAGIAAIAGLVAAAASIYSVSYQANRLSKLRLAEFRREWIEMVRIKLAEFLSCTIRFSAMKIREDNLTDEFLSLSSKQDELFSFLSLCLNQKEKSHEELTHLMHFMISHKWEDIDQEYKRLGFNFIEKSQEVLRTEWKRLKLEM